MNRFVFAIILGFGFLSPVGPLRAQVDISESTGQSMPPTQVTFPEENFNFGEIQEGDKVVHRFEVQNTGANPLKIQNVKPSCGCTASDYTKEDIPVGGKGFVEVTFDSKGKSGIQKKSVTITFENTDPKNKVITFQGEVITNENNEIEYGDIDGVYGPLDSGYTESYEDQSWSSKPVITLPVTSFSIKEVDHDFGNVKKGALLTYVFTIENTGKKPLQLNSVGVSSPSLSTVWTEEPIAPGKTKEIKVTMDTKDLVGIQTRVVNLSFDNTNPSQVALKMTANIKPN